MWTLSGMEIQQHPSRYANAAQWLRYSNVSHPGDVEELTQTEQGGGNTEGSEDRTGELLRRQAEAHKHTRTHTMEQTLFLNLRTRRHTQADFLHLLMHLQPIHTCMHSPIFCDRRCCEAIASLTDRIHQTERGNIQLDK